MAFADGENLVRRFEEMVGRGWVPREDNLAHQRGDLVWHPGFVSAGLGHFEILRISYYTSCVGSDEKRAGLRARIKSLRFANDLDSRLPDTLSPIVFSRDKGTGRSKGVDIALTVDVLTQVWQDNLDTVILLTGDGDYAPLIDEIRRSGKQVFIGAFSSGLSEVLVNRADRLHRLEGLAFASGPKAPNAAEHS